MIIQPASMLSPRQMPLLLALLSMALLPCLCIRPTRPVVANPNTESSPSNLMFFLSLENPLPASGYLMLTLTPFTTAAVPTYCNVLNNMTLAISKCVNLNDPSSAITITQGLVNSVNPNINASQTVVIQFSAPLDANREYAVQIMTANVLPNIGSITTSFEAYAITSTGVMIEENWNFGQIYMQPKQPKGLNVNSRNPMISNLPGQSFTNLLFQITIGINNPTSTSRLKFVIDGGFTFTDSSIINAQAMIGPAPVFLSKEIVSPNVLIATFNESFVNGRKFIITIADYKNPLSISQGFISVYHLPFNSMSPLQISEQNIRIATVPFVPTINILTVEGVAPVAPMQFYTSNSQYIRLEISVKRDIDPNFVIYVDTDNLAVHEGSVFAQTNTVNSARLEYVIDADTRGFKVKGFPLIPLDSRITITFRAYISVQPIFVVTVMIDKEENLANPIILGSRSSVPAANPDSYISLLTGSQNQPNKLSWMKTGDSSISFTVTPLFSTNAGSSLRIFTSKNLFKTVSFVQASSCIVAGNPERCTIVSDTVYTNITIASNSSYNLFPQAVPTTVVINNVGFLAASSHTQYAYHMYFSLVVSESLGASVRNLLMLPCVVPQRDRFTSFQNYITNNMMNTGANYPNIVRLVSWSTAAWQNVIQVFERRIISVFCRQGWTNLFALSPGAAYPGISSNPGFVFTYYKGTTVYQSPDFPIDWDRVDIVLDGTESSNLFSIGLPTLFTTAAIEYEIAIGVYNTITRRIQYLQIQPRPVSPNPTYIQPGAALLSSKPKVTTNRIDLAGRSGSYKDGIKITITPGSGSYSAGQYAAALVVVSDWQWFDSTTTFAASSLASANPLFANNEQAPKSIYMPINQKYLTYIPIKTSSAVSTQFVITMNQVKLPYAGDLPYYSIYLVDGTGSIDCYNEFINQDKAVFYGSVLRSLAFTCNVASLGVENTFCTLTFVPNHAIEVQSMFRVTFIGMQVSTNMCTLTQLPATSVPATCESNTDKNRLNLRILNTVRLAAGNSYSIRVYGVSITDNTILHYIVAELYDPTGSYVIENGTRILSTSVSSFMPVFITEVQYDKNNPIVFSGFTIRFVLPRQLNADEMFAVVISKDLSNLNTVYSKLNVKLYDSSDLLIPATWKLDLKNEQILFQGLVGVLTASSYTIRINGIRTPSTIQQNLVSLIYIREFDSTNTVYNNAESTTTFPALSDKINSMITLTPMFNTEGLEQQLVFTITNQFLPVSHRTEWVVNLPRYYSEHLWNEDYLRYCTINGTQIECIRDPDTPYQIKIRGSSRIFQVGQTYVIVVYGLPCPRADYLNGNAQYVTESIFMGISEDSTSPAYMQYSELFVTDTIINPKTNYGSITITGVQSSNMEVLQSSFLIINATCSRSIGGTQGIYITFPQQFDNFHDLPLTVRVVQGSLNNTYTAETVNRRLGFKMNSAALLANTVFSIQISSLPTPSLPGAVDMNKVRIMATTPSDDATTAASVQLHNLVRQIVFTPSALHIVINNYQSILVTAGTYSLPVLIEPSDFGTFVSNMRISFVSSALSFRDSPTEMFLGQRSSSFSVGADQNLIPTLYAFDIIKSEASISAFYTSLTKYTVLVSNIPVSISLPPTFTVPLGGCSVPYLVSLSNPPYSDLNIQFQYDSLLFNLHLFWVNEQTTYNMLQFNTTVTKRWLSFCSDPALSASTVAITAYLGGTNSRAYTLTNSAISVNIVSNASTNVAPSFSVVPRNLQKTYAGFVVTANIPGQVFYELNILPMGSSMRLVDLKATIKENRLVIESQADYLARVYQQDRYRRVGIISVFAGPNTLEFEDLLPGFSYSLCAYFENQHREVTGQNCQTFWTIAWGIITKAIITFNTTVYESQLNKVLCFFVKASEALITQVVTSEGLSCSLNNAPQNYHYSYQGATASNYLRQTMVYLMTNKNLTTDPAVAKFASIYNSTGIRASSLSLALSTFAVNYIQSSMLMGTVDPPTLIGRTASLSPSFSSSEPRFDAASSTLTVSNIALDKPGAIYMVLVFCRRIIYNKITGYADIEIRQPRTPSAQQILNCLDGYYETPLACQRVVLLGNSNAEVTFTNVDANSLYVVYYAVANQYPLRPVIVSEVANYTILTAYEGLLGQGLALVGLLLAFLMAQ